MLKILIKLPPPLLIKPSIQLSIQSSLYPLTQLLLRVLTKLYSQHLPMPSLQLLTKPSPYDNDCLRELSRKLSDIIPENDESNRRDNRRKENRRNNPRDTLRDTPKNGRGKKPPRRSDQWNKTFKNECGIHKNHEWADYRMNPVNSGGNRQSNDQGRSRRQEHQHNRRRQPSNSPLS